MDDHQTAMQSSQDLLTFLEFANLGGSLTIIGFIINLLNNLEKRMMERIAQIVTIASTGAPGEYQEVLQSIAKLLRVIAIAQERKQDYPYRDDEDRDR